MRETLVVLLATSVACFSTSGTPAVRHRAFRPYRSVCHMKEQGIFRVPKSTDTAAADQAQRAADEGVSPAEYAETIRRAAREHLDSRGAHVSMSTSPSGPPQQAAFLRQLWDVDSIPALPDDAASDPTRVLATVYEIGATQEGQNTFLRECFDKSVMTLCSLLCCARPCPGGPLTAILSTSVAKKLPLIPHVGIRVHGVEYFYSDHIECRTVPVMEEMLGERPQVTLDLGPCDVSAQEVRQVVQSLDAQWTAEDYHVFDNNCVHFAAVLAARISTKGLPPALLQGVLDITERMLDSLPEWRRALGRRAMNEVTRLVVVAWGKASKEKKEKTALALGLEQGA